MIKTTNIYLGTTRDGYMVFDREDSTFLLENGVTLKLLKKALSMMYANGSSFKEKEVHFPHQIGFKRHVKTTPEDEIIMVYRKGHLGQTPMVKNRKPKGSNALTIVIRKEEGYENHYTLISCFIGGGYVREPWDKGIRTTEERKRSLEFWSSHALAYNPKIVDWDRTKKNPT